MSEVKFIADTHFGHAAVAKMRGMTVEEHDELLINNWNTSVKDDDIVYVIGDFCFEDPKLIEYYVSRLNGHIRIIGGNHDTVECSLEFARLGIPVLGCLEYNGYIITHIPIRIYELTRFKKYNQVWKGNIHGHIHDEYLSTPYYNVSAEVIDYTPKTLSEIVE